MIEKNSQIFCKNSTTGDMLWYTLSQVHEAPTAIPNGSFNTYICKSTFEHD